jgi:hypothetical protein
MYFRMLFLNIVHIFHKNQFLIIKFSKHESFSIKIATSYIEIISRETNESFGLPTSSDPNYKLSRKKRRLSLRFTKQHFSKILHKKANNSCSCVMHARLKLYPLKNELLQDMNNVGLCQNQNSLSNVNRKILMYAETIRVNSVKYPQRRD